MAGLDFRAANTKGGIAVVTYGGTTFLTKTDISHGWEPMWADVPSSQYGPTTDRVESDKVIRQELDLYGHWGSLDLLFPAWMSSGAGNAAPPLGQRLFCADGTTPTDTPLVILAANNDQITIQNARPTKLSDLYLGVDNDCWAARVEFTGLLKNGKLPYEADAYRTKATGSYAAISAVPALTRTSFAAVWGAITGFTSFHAKAGWHIAWNYDLEPDKCSDYGTIDFILRNFYVTARCIPIEPTFAQSDTAAKYESTGTGPGTLLSSRTAATLTITGVGTGAPVIAMPNMYLESYKSEFGIVPLRNGEHVWRNIPKLTAGVPQIITTLSSAA